MSVITLSRLKNDLIKSGLVLGDVVMVHASIKAIGELVGGPDIVIMAIRDIIGQSGTIMMYVAWEDNPYHLMDFPLEKQKAYFEELPPFDIFSSRAKRDHGILAEFLRTTSGTLRSQNPGASVCALGKDAKLITDNHPFNYGYGNGSPFDQLCQLGGKILILGSPLAHITLYHYSESLCNVVNKRIVKWKCPILQNKEKVWVEIEEFDTSNGIVDWEGDYFPLITGNYIENRNIISRKVGNADCFLFDANDLNGFAVQWMEDKFGNLEEL